MTLSSSSSHAVTVNQTIKKRTNIRFPRILKLTMVSHVLIALNIVPRNTIGVLSLTFRHYNLSKIPEALRNRRFSFIPPQQQQQQLQRRQPERRNVKNTKTCLFSTASNNLNGDILSALNGSNKDDFASLNHPGYTSSPDEETGVGGWLSHRIPESEKSNCWVQEISNDLTKFDYTKYSLSHPPRILVIYGSLRDTSFSKKLAHEFARLLEALGCDVRTYHSKGLPVRDPTLENELKVQEIRALSTWSEGQVWVSPEMHGTITGAFKNQIDWLPLNSGSVRPTQGRTCMVAQVNGGSQSFNAVNALRILARWMRMPCCTNQSSVPKAWQEFDDDGRMKDSALRDRVIDVAEEFAKFTCVMTPVADDLVDRYSERKEKAKEGKLLTQEEKELKKTVTEARKS